MSTELIKLTAIHEAGHMVIARKHGFRCNFTDCSAATPGEGKTSISYGMYQPLVNMLINHHLLREDLDQLKKSNAKEITDFFSSFILVLSAGTAAEIIYAKQNGQVPPQTMSAADGDTLATSIEALESVGLPVDQSSIQMSMAISIGLFKVPELWNAVTGIAELILTKPGLRLDLAEIETYFSSINF